MLWGEMRWQLNEGWPHALLQGEQACDEVVRGSFAIFKAPIMRNDLREFATELKAFGRRLRPFAHFIGLVNAVMRGIEFDGSKLRSIRFGIQPSWRFRGISAADPLRDVPRRSTCRNCEGLGRILQEPRSLGQGKKSRGVSSMDGSFPNFIPEQISTHSSGIGSYAADDPRDEVYQSSF